MSLKEKYEKTVKDEKNRKKAAEQLKVFEGYGFGMFRREGETLADSLYSSAENSSPMKLPAAAEAMVKEAVEIIKPDKWKKLTLHYSPDSYHFRKRQGIGDYYLVILTPENFDREYFRYKWPDGSIHFDCIWDTRKEIFYMGSKIGARLKGAQTAKELISEANRRREKLRPYLVGEQEYVVLNRYDGILYVLFRDGTLFSEYGAGTKPIFTDSSKLEQFLLDSVRRINESD